MSVQSGAFFEETFVCSTSASLSAAQYCAVALTTAAGTGGLSGVPGSLPVMILCTGASQGSAGAFGILQDNPGVGRTGAVRYLGTSKMVATTSAAILVGSQIAVNATGQAMVADTTGQRVLGICISPSTTLLAGALIEVLMPAPHSLGLV